MATFDPDRRAVEAARRDPGMFDPLYRRYVAQVYSFAFYELGNHHEAEDVTARTFTLALAALPRFDERARPDQDAGTSTFRVWLFRIARNVIANHRRTARRRPAAPLEAASGMVSSVSVEGAVVGRQESAAAWDAIRRLSDDRRRVVILRFVDEMSTAEIAAILGRSEGAVRVLLHRALRSVARDLEWAGDGTRGGRTRGSARPGRPRGDGGR